MDNTEREALAKKLVATAYLNGDFLLVSGRRSKSYFDKYRFETQPDLLRTVGELITEHIPAGTARIAGPELGAVALAAAASLASGIPFLIVRSGQKAYGTGKQIEGIYEQGESVVVVEDVMTSGGSAIQAARVLVEAGCKVDTIIGVIDREEGARAAVLAAGLKLEALFTRTELDKWLK